jgi:hypothetical protein
MKCLLVAPLILALSLPVRAEPDPKQLCAQLLVKESIKRTSTKVLQKSAGLLIEEENRLRQIYQVKYADPKKEPFKNLEPLKTIYRKYEKDSADKSKSLYAVSDAKLPIFKLAGIERAEFYRSLSFGGKLYEKMEKEDGSKLFQVLINGKDIVFDDVEYKAEDFKEANDLYRELKGRDIIQAFCGAYGINYRG